MLTITGARCANAAGCELDGAGKALWLIAARALGAGGATLGAGGATLGAGGATLAVAFGGADEARRGFSGPRAMRANSARSDAGDCGRLCMATGPAGRTELRGAGAGAEGRTELRGGGGTEPVTEASGCQLAMPACHTRLASSMTPRRRASMSSAEVISLTSPEPRVTCQRSTAAEALPARREGRELERSWLDIVMARQ
jgi:hypothetical protein